MIAPRPSLLLLASLLFACAPCGDRGRSESESAEENLSSDRPDAVLFELEIHDVETALATFDFVPGLSATTLIEFFSGEAIEGELASLVPRASRIDVLAIGDSGPSGEPPSHFAVAVALPQALSTFAASSAERWGLSPYGEHGVVRGRELILATDETTLEQCAGYLLRSRGNSSRAAEVFEGQRPALRARFENRAWASLAVPMFRETLEEWVRDGEDQISAERGRHDDQPWLDPERALRALESLASGALDKLGEAEDAVLELSPGAEGVQELSLHLMMAESSRLRMEAVSASELPAFPPQVAFAFFRASPSPALAEFSEALSGESSAAIAEPWTEDQLLSLGANGQGPYLMAEQRGALPQGAMQSLGSSSLLRGLAEGAGCQVTPSAGDTFGEEVTLCGGVLTALQERHEDGLGRLVLRPEGESPPWSFSRRAPQGALSELLPRRASSLVALDFAALTRLSSALPGESMPGDDSGNTPRPSRALTLALEPSTDGVQWVMRFHPGALRLLGDALGESAE